ncbi:hypothetical protein Tco_1374848 [Tanacetum coccineum]
MYNLGVIKITFTANNKVELLYPSHPNQEYFKNVSDFISKCCLKEAFTRSPTQYKEYLSEFWYTAKTLEGSKVWVSTPTGGVRGDIEVPQVKKPGAKSGLKRKQSSKHISESKTEASKSKTGQSEKDTQSNSAKDKSSSHPSPPTLVVGNMHKEAQQAADGPTSLGATSEEVTHPQLSSGSNLNVLVDKTKSAGDGLKTAHIDSGVNEASRADDILLKVKLEDLSDILKDTRFAFFTLDSPPDKPITVSYKSEKEEEVSNDKDTDATSHDVPEDTLLPPPPSPKSAQIQELMAQVAELKNIQWELPAEFLNLPSQVSSVQEKLKTLDSLPSLLHKVTDTLNRFATMVENSSGATSMNVPSAGKATASPTEGKRTPKMLT